MKLDQCRKLLSLVLVMLMFAVLAACAPSQSPTAPTQRNSSSPSSPTITNQQPIEVVSLIESRAQPSKNPSDPIVEITLKNVSQEAIVSLLATLQIRNPTPFVFKFDATAANPLLPGNSVSSKMTLIGGDFGDGIVYVLMVNGTLQNGESFSYTKTVQIPP